MTATDITASAWGEVVGQDDAVGQLRAAALAPVHAYLLVGPHGSGKRAAARAFAAELLAMGLPAAEAERAATLAAAEQHPDLKVFAPEGARILVGQVERIIGEAARTPIEGTRKVLVLCEMHRIEMYGAMLLKTIEEPPASAVFVLLADEVVPDLVTIASRCVRIPFGPVPELAIRDRLVAEGAAPDAAAGAAAAAYGDLDRARLLVTDEALAARRDAWRRVPARLDGTGAIVAELVVELRGLIDESQGPLEDRHRAELVELDEREARYGTRGSGRRELVDRHKREIRRHRTTELRFGFATLAGWYRDLLATDEAGPVAVAAIGAINAAAEALIRNPNEPLLLQSLLVRIGPP